MTALHACAGQLQAPRKYPQQVAGDSQLPAKACSQEQQYFASPSSPEGNIPSCGGQGGIEGWNDRSDPEKQQVRQPDLLHLLQVACLNYPAISASHGLVAGLSVLSQCKL